MIKFLSLSMLILATIQGDCNSYNPVCGTDGITYTNVCKCREAKVDVGYQGACKRNVAIEWVKKPVEKVQKNYSYYHSEPV